MDYSKKAIMATIALVIAASAFCVMQVDDVDAAEIETTAEPMPHPTYGLYVVVDAKGLTGNAEYVISPGAISGGSVVSNGKVYCGPITGSLSDGSYTITVSVGDDTLVANFTIGTPAEGYTVTITPVEGATVTVMNDGVAVNSGDKVPAGTVLDVTVEVQEGYKLGEGQDATYTVTVTEDTVITPNVVKDDAPVEGYTVTIIQVDNATITVMNGENVVNSGDKVPAGTILNVAVVPAEGYKLADGEEEVYSETVNSDITITTAVVKDDAPVEGYTVTITPVEGATVTVMNDGVAVNSGDKVPAGTVLDVTVEVQEGYKLGEGQLANYEVTVDSDVTIAVNVIKDTTPVKPDESIEMLEQKVSGEAISVDGTPQQYAKNQIVIVDGSWTITAGTTVYIYGQLVVPEGATLTVEPGATLFLDNTRTDIDVAEIEGTLVISEFEEADDGKILEAYVYIVNGTVDVTGTVAIDGILDIADGKLVIEMDANVTVSEEGIVTSEAATDTIEAVVVVKESAAFTVNGRLATAGGYFIIDNYGTVTIDSAVAMDSGIGIKQMASGAVVQIDEFTVSSMGSIEITDMFAEIYTQKIDKNNTKPYVVSDAKDAEGNAIGNYVDIELMSDGKLDVLASVSGITVTTTISSSATSGDGKLDASNRYYTAVMSVQGAVTTTEYYDGEADAPEEMASKATISLDGSNVVVSADLTVGSDVTVDNYGMLTVSAALDATAEDAAFVNDGTVTVSGAGIVKVKTSLKNAVNATMYQTGSSKDRVYSYVTIDTALATVNADATIKQITALGNNTVTASATLPSTATLTVNGSISVGQRNGSDVVLTIAKGADLKGSGSVDVKGTLYAEDKSDISSNVSITADVYSEQVKDGKAVKNGWAKWTNLTTALNEANAGDVIEVYRETDSVKIESNTTIPADVTLYVEAGKAPLKVMDGITLTVNGTLDTEVEVLAETRFANAAMDVEGSDSTPAVKSSVIIVNGYLFTAQQVTYADGEASIIAGAPIAGVYYQYDGKYAVSTLENAIAVLDKVESDLTVRGVVTAGDVSFTATEECTKIVVSNDKVTTIGANPSTIDTLLTVSSLTISGASVEIKGAMTGSIAVGDASVSVSNVTGMTVADKSGKMELTGTAATGAAAKSASVTVSAGEVTGKMKSDVKTFTVASGATLVADGANVSNLVIDGTVSVASNKNLAASTVTVNGSGTLSVAASSNTSNAGTATINVLNAGVKRSDYTGAAAAVNGPLSISGQAFVAADAVLDDAAKASLPSRSTEYYVEDALWMTVYSAVDYQIGNVDKAPVENAYFSKKWYDEDNNDVTEKDVGSESAVYADIEYEVYNITLLANEGVDDVFIDGIMMYKVSQNTYTATIAAGSHNVTYTLANGYDGTATLYMDGVAQSSMSFTATGTPETSRGIDITLQVSGIEKSGYVDPVDPTPVQPTDDNDDGMTITDYLLIVLVVLIVIIAILVAVRLMRS